MQDAAVTEQSRLARAIDHTKLTFNPGEDEQAAIRQLCEEAHQFGFYAVCVRPRHVRECKDLLAGGSVKIATVIGFPKDKIQLENELENPTVGSISSDEKMSEIVQAVQDGTDELDLVINVRQLKEDIRTGQQSVAGELGKARKLADGTLIKVIIEIDLLSPEEVVQATRWCAETEMDMVKTSTGMVTGGRGATLEAIDLIAQTLKEMNLPLGIKASGGIKSREQAEAFLKAGVQRIGTSSGIAILRNVHPNDGNAY